MEIELFVYPPEIKEPVEVEVDSDWSLEEVVEELVYLNKISKDAQAYDPYNDKGELLNVVLDLTSNGLVNGAKIFLATKGQQPNLDLDESPTDPMDVQEESADVEDLEEGFGVPKSFHQLGILLLDGSGSMERKGDQGKTLAEQVDNAVGSFLKDFKRSSIAINFSIAVITFDTEAIVHTVPTELKKINEGTSYNPLTHHGGKTHIGKALEKAEELAKSHLESGENDLEKDVVMIVMSDGLCLFPGPTLGIADRIKKNSSIQIASTFFKVDREKEDDETKESQDLLRKIASKKSLFLATYGIDELRKFFTSSLSMRNNAKKDRML